MSEKLGYTIDPDNYEDKVYKGPLNKLSILGVAISKMKEGTFQALIGDLAVMNTPKYDARNEPFVAKVAQAGMEGIEMVDITIYPAIRYKKKYE